MHCLLRGSFPCKRSRMDDGNTGGRGNRKGGTRTVGIPSTIGSGPLIATLRNDVTLYTIDDGKYLWVVSRRMMKKNDKPLDLTINIPVKFAVEKQDCYLLDDEGKEHKLVVEKKTLKPKEPQK